MIMRGIALKYNEEVRLMSDEKTMNNSPEGEGTHEASANEESFAELFERSVQAPNRLVPGRRVKTTVVSISGDSVYVDLGGKSEGVIAASEFIGEDGTLDVREGDGVEAFFLSVQDGTKKLTTLVHGYSSAKLEILRNAQSTGSPVEGEVKGEVKGGFEVSAGGVKCFCPLSQIDLRGNNQGGSYIGKTFQFKVLEYKRDGRNVVLSRRALLEEERRERIEKLRENLSVGMEVSGPVRSVQKFGAFVDLGGVDALIPLSEISWGRSENIEDMISVGKEVTAKILSLDWENNRFTLSIKALQPDPWLDSARKYTVGSKVNGTIVRLVPFGAFVALEPGIDGLIHISNLGTGRRINHPKEVVSLGQQVEAYVLAVDADSRKISLSLQPRPEPKKIEYPAEGALITGMVEKVMPFGVFLKIGDGLTGLVPNSELDTPAGSDHGAMFPAGTEMQVVVMEVVPSRNRVSLSRKRVKAKEEKDELRRYKDSVRKQEGNSFGGIGRLGELLKSEMDKRNFTVS